MKRKKLEKILTQNGCLKLREGSNHSVWKNMLNGKQTSIPRHNEIVEFTVKVIFKQLEIHNQ